MSAALKHTMSLPDFLAWEERQEHRWEFDGFAPVAMTGGTNEHEGIGTRLRTLLDVALMGKPCKVRGPTMKIEAAGRIRYPDAFVTCAPIPRGATIAPEPIVVFEVLSPSTSRTDRIAKLGEYFATPSIQRYVILEQDSAAATVFVRGEHAWSVQVLTGADVLTLPEIGVDLPLPGIYAGIELAPPEMDEA